MEFDPQIDANHRHRELLETLYGLREILRGEIGPERRRDFDQMLRVDGELVEVRFARLEERVRSHGRLHAAFGAALSIIAGALAVLAD